jgi:carboxyl-terminal processing protease
VKSWILFAVTLVLLFASAATLVSLTVRRFGTSAAETVPGESLYREIMGRVVRQYMEPIDDERVVYGAMRGLASELDPHSRIFDPAEWAAFQRESRGEQSGIGIRIARLDGAVIVGWVAPGGPADGAGIRPGDRIVGIEGGPDDQDPDALLGALRGPAGTRVVILLADKEGGSRRRAEVTRGVFDVATVHARVLEKPRVLYCRVSAFRPNTLPAFEQALAAAPLGEIAGMILDLRFNRGGAFESAVSMADAWLGNGVIVTTRGPAREDVRNATPEAPLAAIPTVVLVNGDTASAAEIVAGALQDAHAAILVGDRTFGKGVVQEIFEFETWGGGMRLTTARYFTPSGRCIDRAMALSRGMSATRGLVPDFVVRVGSGAEAALERLLDRESFPDWLRNALLREDPARDGGDPQLEAGLAVLAGAPPDPSMDDAAAAFEAGEVR